MGLVAKAFQDIITFSRATQTGTYVNSSGYITNSSVLNYLTYSNQPENAAWTKSNSFVQQNLLLYSEDFTNANWTTVSVAAPTANTTIAPDGTLTADTITASAGASAHNIQQSTAPSLSPVTFSLYVKAGTHGFIQLFHGANSAYYANFNISTGALGTVGGSASATIAAAPNGFYRCTLTVTPSAASALRIAFITSATAVYNESWTAAGTETVFIWGAQLVQGSVPGDYRATTSAALPCLYADYNGALRARKLCEDATASTTHRYFQAQNTSGSTSSFSGYFKAGERNWVYLRFVDATVQTKLAYFDLLSGTVGTVDAGVSANIQFIGNGWYRCTLFGPAINGSNTLLIGTTTADNTVTYSGDGSSGIYIADAQLNDGSSALAYYNTDAYAYNAPRFDYDPVTLAAKGLLVEEQRVNLLLQSNDWSNAIWNKGTNITLTAAATLGPDGNVSATKLQATASAAAIVNQSFTSTATSHTYSVYAKQGSGATDGNAFAINNNTTATLLANLTINYATGVITQTLGTGATAASAGNGYWRIQIPVTSGITIGNILQVYTGFIGNAETAGEFLYAYGSQVEAGAFATSYIPTVASQVTRAADVASVNTLSPWYNSVAGTLYAEWDYIGDGSTSNPNTRTTVGISDGTSNNRFQIYNISGNTGGLIQTGGVTQAALDAGATTAANTIVKGALAYATNDAAYSRNGGAPSTDVSVTLPTVNVMYLGTEPAAQRLSGHLRRITYYPRRLTNAELQTLTTL